MLTNTTTVNRYLINGTPLATYSISFPYWDKDEIKVYLTESDGTLQTLVENTNYTLSTPNGNNGTLTRVGDWTAGATNLTIAREMSLTQEVDLRNGDKIDAETLETALDDLTAQVQQLAETQERSVVSPIDEAGASLVLPSSSERAGSGSGTIMGFGANGDTIALRDLAQFDTDVSNTASNASAAESFKDEAKDWATKTPDPVSGMDYSAKQYALNAGVHAATAKGYRDTVVGYSTQINAIYADLTNVDTVATNISDVSAVGGDIAKVTAVADDLTNIDAVNANKTNIDTVATNISDVSAVGGDIVKVTAVADDLTNIDAVANNKTNIDAVAAVDSDLTTVAGIASAVTTVAGATSDIAAILPDVADISAVAGDLTKVTAVADDLTNIDNVADDLTNIDNVSSFKTSINTVASDITAVAHVAANMTNVLSVDSNSTNINTVAAKITDISSVSNDLSSVTAVANDLTNIDDVAAIDDEIVDVAGIKSDVSAVSGAISDVSAVAAGLTDIGTVATDISDVSTVAADIANVLAVAGDLTNINAVAADLSNIDDAKDYASLARQYSEGKKLDGTDVTSGEPGYHNNAKYWADAVPALQAQINANSARITNLEQTTKQDEQTVAYPNDGNFSSIMPNGVPVRVADYGIWDRARGKSRGWNRFIKSSDLVTGTFYDVIFSMAADGKLQLSGTCSGDAQIQIVANDVGACVAGHQYLLVGGTANFNIRPYDSLDWDTGSGIIFTAQSTNSLRLAGKLVNATVYNQKSHIFARDLTTIFPEGVPATVAACVKACPDILKYDAYGYSLVNTTVTGVEARDSSDNVIATLMLSTPVTLKSAGAVSEELDVQTGKKTRPIGSVDLGTLSWSLADGRWVTLFSGYSFVSNNQACNMTAAKYSTTSALDVYLNVSINIIAGEGGTLLSVYNGSDSITPTGILYYELAVPLSDEQVCDPIIDNYIEVQAGGTINTIQSQSPVIDNCLDVTYDFIPA